MVESKFSFFQVQVKRMFGHAVKLGQAALCIAPERLNTIDMPLTIRKLILAMVYPKVLVKTNVHQTVIAAPAIGMNHGAGFHMAADNTLERGFGAVRHNLGIDFALTLQESEHNRFAISPATAFATNPMRTEVRFIDFYRALQWRFQFARISNARPNLQVNTVHRPDGNSSQFSAASGREIQGKTPDKLPEFSFADFRTAVVPIFINHIRKLSHLNRCFAS